MDAKTKQNPTGRRAAGSIEHRARGLRLWPTLVAGGACGLVAGQAGALELGSLQVESGLGQPLRASISFALNEHEQLHDYCIFVRPGTGANGLPAVTRADVSVANGRILLRGSAPINEPILGLSLTVECPYTANLTRNFTLMLDPVLPAAARQAAAQQAVPATPVARPTSVATRSSRRPTTPIAAGSTYRVQVGDTLSGIAERIENRPVDLWPAVGAIFAANRDAFLDGDMNRLKAGAPLHIPAFDGPVAATTPAVDVPTPTATPARPTPAPETYATYPTTVTTADVPAGSSMDGPAGDIAPSLPTDATTAPADPATAAASPTQPLAAAASVAAEPAVDTPTATLRPGDVIVGAGPGSNATAAPPATATERTPAPRVTTAPPRTAVVRSGAAAGGWSWLVWLAASGLALVLGVFYVGRRYKDGFGSEPVGKPAAPSRRRRRQAREQAEEKLRSLAHEEVDYTVEETTPGAHVFALDADLGIGTGLSDADDMDVAQDFGFSTVNDLAADLDLEIPEGADKEPEAQPTDIIEPHLPKMHSILDSEVLPSTHDDYDLSMIVDATQQSFEDTDVTEKDLFAVPVGAEDDNASSGSYTINDDMGTRLIEQDYEKEHAATQAIDADIVRAALALSDSMDETDEDEDEVRMEVDAEVLDLVLPDEEALSDLDDTGVNTALTAEMPSPSGDADLDDATVLMADPEADVTAEMPARDRADETGELTARLPGRMNDESGMHLDLTTEMRKAENESTAEMEVESGHVNTKKRIG